MAEPLLEAERLEREARETRERLQEREREINVEAAAAATAVKERRKGELDEIRHQAEELEAGAAAIRQKDAHNNGGFGIFG